MADLDVVSTFMTMVEETPVADNFEQWWQGMWVPLQTKCLNIARHQYVLQSALNRYKQVEATTWEESFVPLDEKQYLRILCLEVGLEAEDFLAFGFNHHQNACRKVFSMARRQL
tara:strand:+ start:5882 stop:6223 length:342 start_codon:yes stop_codon:yes gene_type:complete